MFVLPFCSIAYLGPGVTSRTHLNMGFRVYTVDATSSNVCIVPIVCGDLYKGMGLEIITYT